MKFKIKSGEKIELTQKQLLTPLTDEQMNRLTSAELRVMLRGEQKIRQFYEESHAMAMELMVLNKELAEKVILIEGKFVRIRSRIFYPKTEKSSKIKKVKDPNKIKKIREKSSKLPSERYPNLPVLKQHLTLDKAPLCHECHGEMKDSGMTEESEVLTVIPKKYFINKIIRHKYSCPCCQSNIETTPAPKRMIPGSAYSDELILDAVLAKYCDWIPIERYCDMAKRQGLVGLPANSLTTLVMTCGDFLYSAYLAILKETLRSKLLLGDETPHRMLEGDAKMRWYLWCFSTPTTCFFECHDTRAGKIAADILRESECLAFMSDAYSGYESAITETNKHRAAMKLPLIMEALCNAHARRYFFECQSGNEHEDASFFIKQYKEIYKLEAEAKKHPESYLILRSQMSPYFTQMKKKATEDLARYSSHSGYYKACQYFINHYDGLTVCLGHIEIPLDNNQSERALRSPVIGRKTWYGTHSKDGAIAAAIHFTIVETCKLNKINPREYYSYIVQVIKDKKEIITPSQYLKVKQQDKERPLHPV